MKTLIQQLSAAPRMQDANATVQPQTTSSTQDSGEFRSLLLKTAQSAKDAAPKGTRDSTSAYQTADEVRLDEDSPPSTADGNLQNDISQAMLFAAQAAAGEVPSQVSAPAAAAQALQSAQNPPLPVAADNLQQPLPHVSGETQQAAIIQTSAEQPAQQFQVSSAAPESQFAQATQATQTVQTLQASPQSAEAGMEIRQNITATPASAELPAETRQTAPQPSAASTEFSVFTEQTAPRQASAATAEFPAAAEQTASQQTPTAMVDTEKASAVSQKAPSLGAAIQPDSPEGQILPQNREKETSAEQTSVSASQQTSVPYSSEKVMIRISDTPAAAKAPVSNQVANSVVQHLKEGKQQFTVDLYPQSLGKVSVKLIAENGTLTIEIAAANPKTQSLLASSSGEIRSLLHASTGQTVEVTTQQYPDQNGAGQNQQQQEQSFAQQQQRQEDAERRRAAAIWFAGNSSGFSAADFLTVLQRTAVS
jgi:hypothetical protein